MSEAPNASRFVPPNLWDTFVYNCVKNSYGIPAMFKNDLEMIGRENIPKKGAALIVANHASDLDPPLVSMLSRRHAIQMAKEELWDHPVGAWVMNRLKCIPVRRGKADRRSLTMAIDALRQGRLVVIFPEGARTRSGEMMPGRAGAALIWSKSRVPMIPVYVDGTFAAKPIGEKKVKPGKITLVVGKPCDFPADFPLARGGAQEYDWLSEFMMRRIAALKARLAD